MQSQRQVQMWQEQSYMVPESGFVSRSNTGPNSAITGQDLDDGGGGGCYTGPGSIVSDRTMGRNVALPQESFSTLTLQDPPSMIFIILTCDRNHCASIKCYIMIRRMTINCHYIPLAHTRDTTIVGTHHKLYLIYIFNKCQLMFASSSCQPYHRSHSNCYHQ